MRYQLPGIFCIYFIMTVHSKDMTVNVMADVMDAFYLTEKMQ